ncbi:hypothetical protein R0131_18370, partial [Clostridium sp. AL.422]|uniref:site-2 protease family protein n=1 Tax=Clostridium TaxID=1485 RepID=UPI00293DAD59
IIHEFGHLITILILRTKLVIFNAYPMTIYNEENNYRFKIAYKILLQGYCIPKFNIVNNKKELDYNTKKLIIISLMGPITNFIFAIIVYYLNGFRITYLITMSSIVGFLSLLFSDGLMIFRLVTSAAYRISTLLFFQQDINENIGYLFNYACKISKEFNITDNFFYLDKENKNQIYLQKLIMYYSLIYDLQINNKIIYVNYNKIKNKLSSLNHSKWDSEHPTNTPGHEQI